MAWSFDLIMDMLTNENRVARELDPAGHQSLRQAKELRRQYQRIGGRRNGPTVDGGRGRRVRAPPPILWDTGTPRPRCFPGRKRSPPTESRHERMVRRSSSRRALATLRS